MSEAKIIGQVLLTRRISWLRARAVPRRRRCAVPHAFLVRRQVSHSANSPVAVASHCRVLRVGHVIGVMAHVVLLQVRLRHLSLSVEWRRQARGAVHGCKLLKGLLDRAQNIAH